MADIHVGDIGAIIRLTVEESSVAVNISAATTKQIKLAPPNGGTVLTKTATFTTDGTDGKIQYATTTGDLSVSGLWTAEGYVVTSNWTVHTAKATFYVAPHVSVT